MADALENLVVMREREGVALLNDLIQNAENLDRMLAEVEKKAPEVPQLYKERLSQRVAENAGRHKRNNR